MSISLDLWNPKYGHAIGTTKKCKEINKHLESITALIYEHFKYLRETEKIITPTMLKNAYLGIEEDKGNRIIQLYQEHNDKIKKLINIDFDKQIKCL